VVPVPLGGRRRAGPAATSSATSRSTPRRPWARGMTARAGRG